MTVLGQNILSIVMLKNDKLSNNNIRLHLVALDICQAIFICHIHKRRQIAIKYSFGILYISNMNLFERKAYYAYFFFFLISLSVSFSHKEFEKNNFSNSHRIPSDYQINQRKNNWMNVWMNERVNESMDVRAQTYEDYLKMISFETSLLI